MTIIEKFLEAIKLTDEAYHIGACKWQEYLETGNLYVFTSKNEARNMMANIDHQTLKQEVFKTIFKNISRYYRVQTNSTTTSNNAVNYIVSNINYYRNKGVSNETYTIICEELLDPVFHQDTVEILKNNIQRVPGATTIYDVNFNVASFLSELLYTKQRAQNGYEQPSIEALQQRIQELELENAQLKAQLQNLNPDNFGSPGR